MRRINHGGSCGDSCCLRVQNLSVQIGGDKILKDVNMHIHCGQLVAIIGPICGTLADRKLKKPIFLLIAVLGALGCAALGFYAIKKKHRKKRRFFKKNVILS